MTRISAGDIVKLPFSLSDSSADDVSGTRSGGFDMVASERDLKGSGDNAPLAAAVMMDDGSMT